LRLMERIVSYTQLNNLSFTYKYFPVLNFAPTGLLMIRTTDSLLILAKTFSEKLFRTLSDQIECDGKNCILPLSFQK
jgi:hypothetical protein